MGLSLNNNNTQLLCIFESLNLSVTKYYTTGFTELQNNDKRTKEVDVA